MAESSDYTGFVPAGTTHHSRSIQASPGNSLNPVVGDWESMTALTALVILYVTLANDPDLFSGLPQVQTLPTDPVPESAVAPHFGLGFWTGPGVRYYVC